MTLLVYVLSILAAAIKASTVSFLSMHDLPIIQKTYDLIKWYVPILNHLARDHRFALGDRIIAGLYDLLEGLIQARYSTQKLPQLEILNTRLDILHHQTRLRRNTGLSAPALLPS